MQQIKEHPWVTDPNIATVDEVRALFEARGLTLLQVPDQFMTRQISAPVSVSSQGRRVYRSGGAMFAQEDDSSSPMEEMVK